MRSSWRSRLTIFVGVLGSILVLANCQMMQTQAVSTLTTEEVESMARRTAPAVGVAGAAPELPRVFIDTTYVAPTGKTIAVPAGGDFQSALNQAQLGDVITLQAGATYTGNFRLPAKTGSGWIVIRTSAPDSSLPGPDARITPSYANVLPKIVTPNAGPAIEAVSGAHHYRFLGVEITATANAPFVYNLMLLGEKETSLALLPHNLIIDRVYIHGRPGFTLRRGIALNSATTSVINSYISDCHEVGADSQAIGGWNGAGPFKIVNNYLEGAGENVIIGGSDPTIPNLVSSDIEFRRNHCFKPLSWRIGDPSYAGTAWGVKNLFELKNAQRVLIDGNLFEHNWTMAQNGIAILFTVRNQDGSAPWSVVQDVTFTNNILRKVAGGINILGLDDNNPSLQTSRVRIANNLLDEIDGTRWSGAGIAIQLVSRPKDITIENNTVLHSGNILAVGDQPTEGVIFRNNLCPHNEYGIKGDNRDSGNATITTYLPGSVIKKNVIAGAPAARYPTDNFYPATIDLVKFTDRNARNYRLTSASPYKNAGTDGRDVGCDFDALDAAINGATVVTNVSAANFTGATLAPGSITAAFGTGLSAGTLASPALPLPTSLGGTTLKVRDRLGVERMSQLFFVSPTQINYLIPPDTATGTSQVTVTNGDRVVATGFFQTAAVAPGLFTVDATGRGLPAGSVLRVRTDSTQRYEPLAAFDAAQNKFIAVPIDLSSASDQVFLILFATGLRYRSSATAVTAKVGGLDVQIPFAGAQGTLSGLDQVNLFLPRSLAGRGDVDVTLTVDGQVANTVRINIK
ncbi:MAG: hypothetical protein SF339_14720 [Blastocatellia bacterium]|nr:hypothetical protein [Blastocatellia bacterium]